MKLIEKEEMDTIKRVRALLSLLLCTCIVLSAVGCGTKNNNANVTTDDVEATTEENAAATTEVPETTPTTEPEASPTQEPTPTVEEIIDTPWDTLYSGKFDAFSVFDLSFFSETLAITIGYDGVINYSNDGGATWVAAENSSSCRYGIYILDENICYTSGNYGEITKSTDGGKTFTKMVNFKSGSQSRIIRFADENNGIAVTQESVMGLTTDGAQTWNDLTLPEDILVVDACMTSPTTIYFIGNDFNLYKSIDSGVTWEATPLNLPGGDDYVNRQKSFALYVGEDNSITIYCIENSTKLLKSFTTTDNCASYVENPMPRVDVVPNYITVNKKGDILTLFNVIGKSVQSLIRR